MRFHLDNRSPKNEARRICSAYALKRCPLCGAINGLLNGECFICRWHGEFDRNPEHIRKGMEDLIESTSEWIANPEPDAVLPSLLDRIISSFRMRFFPQRGRAKKVPQ